MSVTVTKFVGKWVVTCCETVLHLHSNVYWNLWSSCVPHWFQFQWDTYKDPTSTKPFWCKVCAAVFNVNWKNIKI